jgi:hypothetical protein
MKRGGRDGTRLLWGWYMDNKKLNMHRTKGDPLVESMPSAWMRAIKRGGRETERLLWGWYMENKSIKYAPYERWPAHQERANCLGVVDERDEERWEEMLSVSCEDDIWRTKL